MLAKFGAVKIENAMTLIMGIINLTPDSFFESSRATAEQAMERISTMVAQGADIIDLGAVSTRPGAADVGVEEEWARLEPVLEQIARCAKAPVISIDTTSAEIVRRAYSVIGPFIVNDISAGEDDPEMLETVGRLGLAYVAMHKRGNPRTMDALCEYEGGIMQELNNYFREFALKADEHGIREWILDPGLGFAKTEEQNWEILERLSELQASGRPILIGAADKRFTHGDTERAHRLALQGGAEILRVHNVPAAICTVDAF